MACQHVFTHVFFIYTCFYTCGMSEETGKKKLTLTVDEKVVENAKHLGFNLSEVTESVLRSFAFKPTKADTEQEYRKYAELFSSMVPLLQQFGAIATVGSVPQKVVEIDGKEWQPPSLGLLLAKDGKIYLEDWEEPYNDIRQIDLWQFASPKQILANFVAALSEAQERRKEKLGELEMAKRVIDAMSQTMRAGKPPKKGEVE